MSQRTHGVFGTLVGVLGHTAFHVAYFTLLAPVWVPFYVVHRIQRVLHPEPRLPRRGTVIPHGGPIR